MRVVMQLSMAPAFIAGLVREGVQFDAYQDGDSMIIKFTGGY